MAMRDDSLTGDAMVLDRTPPFGNFTAATPIRVYTLRDGMGQLPPMVPTVEALEVWGYFWWRREHIVIVHRTLEWQHLGSDIFYDQHHPDDFDDVPDELKGDAAWLGPVTERPRNK